MSDRLRMTGMASGMDTQSIVEQLVQAQSYKKKEMTNNQTKLGWKQESWKTLNSKIYSFYTDKISNMRYDSFFDKKKASIVDSSIASVTAKGQAVNGVQTLAVKQLAKSAYVTGKKLDNVNSKTTVADLTGDDNERVYKVYTGPDDETGTTVSITKDMKMSDVASAFAKAGINASFDEKNNRFFLSAKESGAANQFRIEAADSEGQYSAENAKNDVFLKSIGVVEGSGASIVEASDAVIELNGAEFKSDTNIFEINGLSITATKVSDYTLKPGATEDTPENRVYTTTNISTETDVDSIYDSVKEVFKEYNELINEMQKLYNADSAKDYNVLTDEEKESMSDEEVEKWEGKIKDSLLRRDKDLGTALDTLRSGMMASFDINGNKYSLSTYGISTISYFDAAENEKYALHIDGDKDDKSTASNSDKLRSAITDDLDSLKEFFKTMSKSLYQTMTKQMASTDFRSVYNMYDDKAMQKEYDRYTEDIKAEEDRISAYEDKWYDKFAAMESAMEKMNSKTNAISGLMGLSS